MKNVMLILSLLLSLLTNAQIDEALKELQLRDGVMYVTYGHRITQEFSELEFRDGVGVYPRTNIAYLSYQQLIVLMQDSAKNEGWNQERYLESRNYLHQHCKGGRIIMYVERFNQFETNTKLFFVILRDMEDNKLMEISLPNRPADLVSAYVFSNWAYINIDQEMPEQFSVYVNNKMTIRLSDTKFNVHQNAAPLFLPQDEAVD